MKVKFFTLGCKVNQYESQALMEEFVYRGYQITKDVADIYIINTCSVTKRADAKSREAILKAKKENPNAKIIACGCMVQLNKEALKDLKVDYLIPQEEKASLVDFICEGRKEKRDIWSLKITYFYNHRAFIKIQDGCDNFCSFCKIPYLRGKSQSREKKEIIEEIKRVSFLHPEIVLCGINLGLYGRDLTPPLKLENLLEEILEIDSLKRLRLSSLEPNLISDRLLSLFGHPKMCKHLHLPFQSGDDEILRLMNKKETVSMYEEIVEKARKVKPLIAISCDIMVGFPYEEDKHFINTINFLKKIKPMRMHIFTFSPRERTPFHNIKMKNQGVFTKRYELLRKMAYNFSVEYKRKFLGKVLYMVAEEKKNNFICGYTENYIKVYLKEEVPLGNIYPVRVEKVEENKVLVSLEKKKW
jgi:threonylcarbamoyladenosine tRNA methylthiotransferase MtaB